MADCSTSSKEGRNVASEAPFFDICQLMEKIHKTTGTESKKKVLRSFLNTWREADKNIHGDSKTTDSFFPAMRLLLPHLDKERPAYGMKEVVLAKYYIDVLSIGKDSTDGKKLLNYRAPTHAKHDAGDFASVAYFVLQNRCPTKGSLSIEDVNSHLDEIAQANLEKKRDVVKKSLQVLLRNTSALEQKWLIRVILRDLKTGLSENSVFSVYHPDAAELHSVCNSLSKVCKDLKDPSVRMNEAEITLFLPFRPMLGQRGSMEQVEKIMNHEAFFIETKIDGERMQLHKQGNSFKYFSRSANEYTHTFGESSREGFLTPHIANCFSSKISSCILDGEMVIYDPQTEMFITKGAHTDVKSATTYDNGLHPCFVAFDVLLVNDKKLANVPLKERIGCLDKVFTARPGYFQLVERRVAQNREDVVKALNKAIDRREEGIVAKAAASVYKPNLRNGSGWLKLKPEYVDSLSDELDVLIVGGYYGVGHRGGMISHFLCAVAVPPSDLGQRPTCFHSFCKVGTGYTMGELQELGRQLHPHWKPFNTNNPPSSVILAPGFKEKPDLWIEPCKSKIVQIKAAEIVASDKYKTGMTLRFPRLEKVRDDKHWYDCLDLPELERLKSMASGKLTYQHTDAAGTSEPTRKKRRLVTRVEKPVTVAQHFRPADVSSVKEVTTLFKDKEFCVINGPSSHPKAKLETMVVENGGMITQNPGPETFCVVADRINARVNNIIRQGKYDVVRASWLVESLDAKAVLPWVPSHMLHKSPATTARFTEEYDSNGDSYTQDLTVDALQHVFSKIDEQNSHVSITSHEILEIEERYFSDQSPLGLFRRCSIYLDQYRVVGEKPTAIRNCSLQLVELELRFFGATICDEFGEEVTHVIFEPSDLSRLPELQRRMRDRPHKHHFVTKDWVWKSLQKGRLEREREYTPTSS